MPVEFPEEEDPGDRELGLAQRSKEKKSARPFVPLTRILQTYIRDLQGSSAPRLRWIQKSFTAPPAMEKEFFSPPLVPRESWHQMQLDQNSWCRPDKAPPTGVEGGAPSKSTPPHKVFPWNEHRDKELRELEALARDGLRVANAALITFAPLINGLLQPDKTLSEKAKQRTLLTRKDLEHVSAEHFARIAHRLAQQRKLNAVRALNLISPADSLKTPIGPDLFGGNWPEIHAAEMEKRKARTEVEKEKQRRAKMFQKKKPS